MPVSSAYCLRLEGRAFSTTPVDRSIFRSGLSCWDLRDSGVLIIGGNNKDSDWTTDLVFDNEDYGLLNSDSFPLQHEIVYYIHKIVQMYL